MLELLDRQTRLTINQKKIVAAAALGDMLEFFDYFLIGFVLAFVVGPWGLTFGQSATILLSSGIGAMLGAAFWGWLADRQGRRMVFIATIVNFSLATGILALTPDHGWIFLTVFRFFVGFGVGGLYSVDLPLVQEFMPASRRGFIGGLVTAFVPVGTMLGAIMGGYLTPFVGWRGLFLLGLLPALLTLLVRAWVPESPRWLMRMGRVEDARRSLAWALQVDPATLPPPTATERDTGRRPWSDLFRYPRSLAVSWLGNLGAQTGVYGLTLWVPTLFVLLLKVTPAQAAALIIPMTVAGLIGRVSFAALSDRIGRRACGGLLGFGAAALILAAGLMHGQFVDLPLLGHCSVLWLLLIAAYFFADGGFAIVGPYAAEVWPAALRTSGMGSAYGFGGLGKIIGPLGLALIVGSANVVKPDVSLDAVVPAFAYLAAWYGLAGIVYAVFGIETRGRSFEELDGDLGAARSSPPVLTAAE
jgi:putative MFS transporter